MKHSVWLVIAALFIALGYYFVNRQAVIEAAVTIKDPNFGFHGGATLKSPDDEYYLTPAENFLAGKGWRRSPGVGAGSYVRRTPGYSLWYLMHRVVFGPVYVFKALLVSQLALYLLSVAAFWQLIIRLIRRRSVQLGVALLYIATPFFSSYAYFTLTEALSVVLMVFLLYALVKAYYADSGSAKTRFYMLAGLMWVFALLTRPLTGLSGILIASILYLDYIHNQHSWRQFLIVGVKLIVLPLLLIGAWTARNYAVTKQIVVLEKNQDPESRDYFTPGFYGLWELYSTAGVKQVPFFEYTLPMFRQAVYAGQTSTQLVEGLLHTMPASERAILGEQRVRNVIATYQLMLAQEYHPYFYPTYRAMPPRYSTTELALADTLAQMRQQLLRVKPLVRIKAPIVVTKDIVLHSNTAHLTMFQEQFRNQHTLVNLLRYALVLLHVALYAFMIIGLLLVWRETATQRTWQLAIIAPAFLLMFLLAVLIGTTEQRYMLIFLPYLLVNAGLVIDQVMQRVAQRQRLRATY